MLTATIQCHQVMRFTRVFISVCETQDDGTSEVVYTANGWCSEEFPEHKPNSPGEFHEQIIEGLVKALSTVDTQGYSAGG